MAVGLSTLTGGAPTESPLPLDLGNRLELFVDQFLIERLEGTRLKLHEPTFRDIALRFDMPWEGGGTGGFTIIQDGSLFRMYYIGLPLTGTKGDEAESYPCYAESSDGIQWTRRQLGLVEFNGTRDNNILFLPRIDEPYAANFTPFLDPRPEIPTSERFKAIGGKRASGIFVLVSPDGIHWKKWRERAVFRRGKLDSYNQVFWSTTEDCFVLYFRVMSESDMSKPLETKASPGLRTIARSTSKDLIEWSEPQRMSFGNTPLEHLYTFSTSAYFRAPHILITTPMRFVRGRQALSPEQFDRLPVIPRYANITSASGEKPVRSEVSDTVLMTSRGGYRFDRTFMEAFIRPGTEPGDWVSRTGMTAIGILPTGTMEISMYRQSRFAQTDAYLGRYALRVDGFSSVNAPFSGGEMVTRPLRVTGEQLMINFATSAAGSIRVEVQQPDGEPIPFFTLSESEEIVGDSPSLPVRWRKETNLGVLSGKAVRLRFVMKDADLYSLRIK